MCIISLLLLLLSYRQNILHKYKVKCRSHISIGHHISLCFHIESGTVKVKPSLRLTRSTPQNILQFSEHQANFNKHFVAVSSRALLLLYNISIMQVSTKRQTTLCEVYAERNLSCYYAWLEFRLLLNIMTENGILRFSCVIFNNYSSSAR